MLPLSLIMWNHSAAISLLGLNLPCQTPTSQSERSWLLFMLHPFKCLKSRLSTHWPSGLENGLWPPGWEEGSGILLERSLPTPKISPPILSAEVS